MILGRDLLTAMGLDLKFSENIIIVGEGLYKWCLVPMVDLGNYDFKYLTNKIVRPSESFINLYIDECLGSDSAISSMQRMRRILDNIHKKADINKVMAKNVNNYPPKNIKDF